MKYHSLIIDDFLSAPTQARGELLEQDMMDYQASDGVTYPGIVRLPKHMEEEIYLRLNTIFGEQVDPDPLMFARFSLADMKPPHWAHSDRQMTEWVGLLYLSPVDLPHDGTHLVKHKQTGMEKHPTTPDQVHTLMSEANDKSKWDITMTCPSKFNRMFIVSADYLHAAATKFGSRKEDARLVCTTFFKLI